MDSQLFYEMEDGILFLRLKGNYPQQEIINLLKNSLADPKISTPAKVLLDLRKSEVDRSTDEVKLFTEEITKLAEFIERFAVLTASETHHGLALMGSFFAEQSGVHIAVFRHYDVAISFLKGVE